MKADVESCFDFSRQLVREIYCDEGLAFKCMHIDPVPAHMAMRVGAWGFHVIEYTTSFSEKRRDAYAAGNLLKH